MTHIFACIFAHDQVSNNTCVMCCLIVCENTNKYILQSNYSKLWGNNVSSLIITITLWIWVKWKYRDTNDLPFCTNSWQLFSYDWRHTLTYEGWSYDWRHKLTYEGWSYDWRHTLTYEGWSYDWRQTMTYGSWSYDWRQTLTYDVWSWVIPGAITSEWIVYGFMCLGRDTGGRLASVCSHTIKKWSDKGSM